MESTTFSGKVALVTGAAGGMGRSIAEAFAAAGASVMCTDRAENGESVAASIRDAGGAAEFRRADVADAASVEAVVAATVAAFGTLDCAVNAAAIEGESERLADLDDALFDQIMAVNVRSVFLCMKHEIRAMQTHGRGGAIVNIASTNSYRPQPHQSAYTASKHAVIGLTKSAAIDYAVDGIRINAICPGSIDTPMLRNAMERRNRSEADVVARLSLIGRFGRPDEIAKAALWLCCDDASFTIGHALAVDGGYLSR